MLRASSRTRSVYGATAATASASASSAPALMTARAGYAEELGRPQARGAWSPREARIGGQDALIVGACLYASASKE